MSAEEIRKNITLLEQSTHLSNNKVNEAAPMGFFQQLKTKAASLFDKSREGDLEIGQIANLWFNEYKKYLRKIGRNDPKDGTVGDVLAFFTGTGFHYKSVLDGLAKASGDRIKNRADLEHFKNVPVKPDTLDKIFLYIMQFQAQKPAASLDPKYWGQKKHTTVRDTPPHRSSDTPPPSSPPSMSDADIIALLQATLGTTLNPGNPDDANKINSLKAALRAAGLIS